MRARVTLQSKTNGHPEPAIFSIGGFAVKRPDGRVCCFDFERYNVSYNISEDGTLQAVCELASRDIDTFIDENKAVGIDDSEVTAEFITTAKLIEVFYECVGLVEDEFNVDKHIIMDVTEFIVVDDDGSAYAFDNTELERYNREDAIHLSVNAQPASN